MLSTIISWFIFALFAFAVMYSVKFLLGLRDMSNKLSIVAASEFFDKADSLMKTPSDLPDSVLDAIQTMMVSMNNGTGARAFLNVLKQLNNDIPTVGKRGVDDADLMSDVKNMRPELGLIFRETVAAWLNYVTNRHVIYNIAITLEVKKLAIKTKSVNVDQAKTVMPAIHKLQAAI